jgi:leucyl aminopeptidase
MGGAAAVLGTVDLAARLKLPIHICAAVPLTENCVDGLSTLPGEVIGSYAGKTIEVIDTDAEGRLILADALSWLIKNHAPDVVVDLATLTGNSVLALGYLGAVYFANNEALSESLVKAADKSGERLWRFPLWEEYGKEMESDVADIKNLATKPVAGAITAAKFLEYFVQPHPAWAHIDIAGVALTDSEFSSQRSATAYGVLLLTQYLQSLIQQH